MRSGAEETATAPQPVRADRVSSVVNQIVFVVLLAPMCAHAAVFGTLVDGRWHYTEREGLCVLSAEVANYGQVTFLARRGGPVRFELQPLRDLFGDTTVTARAVAPSWHADHPSANERGAMRHVRGGVTSTQDPVASRLLLDLYEGYALEFQGGRAQLGNVTVAVSPARFSAAYTQFFECAHTMLPANFADVERSRVRFATNSARISANDRTRLDLLARYVAADDGVQTVFIDGHADGSGSERHNIALSRKRARTVRDYLLAQGVPADRLVERFHAARYPAASNKTAEGRARNRRTTVRLERAETATEIATAH